VTSDTPLLEDEILDVWRWVVEEDERGARIDLFLCGREEIELTRSQLKRLVDRGLARVDGVPVRPAKALRPGQIVELRIPPPEPLSAVAEPIPIEVRFEDEHVVVIDKPQGLVVHPAPGHPRGTLVNALLYRCALQGGDPLRPGIVHRLDKDTSGLMVVAKTEAAHAHLAVQFHARTVDRRYTVLVAGAPPDRGEWSTLYGRRAGDRKLFSSRVRRGKTAVSAFETVERFPDGPAARLRVKLATGRTHQVRVHCADHGLPVLGDRAYGPKRLAPSLRAVHDALPGQALHAELLGFDHPVTGERLRFESAPNPAFTAALGALRRLGAADPERRDPAD
jgi:23S rRNA pseudouridine1911/1915/1917 synthase